MTDTVDAPNPRAGQFAHRLLIEYARGDSTAIARVADELALEDDPELTLIVLDRALQVSVGLLVTLADRVGVNPRRAIEDAFPVRPPR
jgi:hypothetical protein